MPRSAKPRKPYRPRPVLLDALTRLQPAPAEQRAHVLLQFHTALEAMRAGHNPGPDEWRHMADCINTLEALTDHLHVLDAAATHPVIHTAQAAMVAAQRRWQRTGRAGLDGPGLQALQDALDLYTQAANGFTQHTMAEARRIAQEQQRRALAQLARQHIGAPDQPQVIAL